MRVGGRGWGGLVFDVLAFSYYNLFSKDTLAKLSAIDAATRVLANKSARIARATLQDRRECIKRHIDRVMMRKALYLFWFSLKKKNIARYGA